MEGKACLSEDCDRPAAYPDGLCRDCHELLCARQVRNNTYTRLVTTKSPRWLRYQDPQAK